jgi:hypothetical protein
MCNKAQGFYGPSGKVETSFSWEKSIWYHHRSGSTLGVVYTLDVLGKDGNRYGLSVQAPVRDRQRAANMLRGARKRLAATVNSHGGRAFIKDQTAINNNEPC